MPAPVLAALIAPNSHRSSDIGLEKKRDREREFNVVVVAAAAAAAVFVVLAPARPD